jgi:hypothetical protein
MLSLALAPRCSIFHERTGLRLCTRLGFWMANTMGVSFDGAKVSAWKDQVHFHDPWSAGRLTEGLREG